MTACFHHEWLAPQASKNRKMVVRTAACKKPKDLATFIRIAAKLPDYRFVMILCSLGPNDHYRELEQLNRDLGRPVEMIRDISYPEVAAYLSEAGIYLHTYSPTVSFGMPVSIAEAMAAGCTIIARNLEGASDYVGDAGSLYATDEEAVALVRATEAWADADWAEAQRKSRERAFNLFDDRKILVPLLEDWKSIAAEEMANRDHKRVSLVTQFRRWLGIGYARV
jgi:glycosyltransferase involved in cell wall biosynthesis